VATNAFGVGPTTESKTGTTGNANILNGQPLSTSDGRESVVTTSGRRIALLAEGSLDFHHGKTAVSLLRYVPDEIVAVIDRENAGRTTAEVLGFGPSVPIVSDVEAALRFHPTELTIGIAPRGGDMPREWRPLLLTALRAGVSVISGLHTMLNDDPELAAAAVLSGAKLTDVRKPPDLHYVAEMRPRRPGSIVLTLVGSDCAVGKMTAALELNASARALGISSEFVATGQTGIMITGRGIPLDRVIGDFMAGGIEMLVSEASERADWIIVEGQGSLLHPGYSGVTLALLHGSQPDGLILVHPPGHDTIDEYTVSIPSLSRLIEIYEQAASWVKPAPVVGICLNTRALGEGDARQAVRLAERETGLPTTDPVRFGSAQFMDAIRDRMRPA
jgi:uncharacterized NAD-dependent epimerase/dehydratase family protein